MLESRVRLSDGAHLRYRVHGEGEPILLVRPLGGSLALWGAFERALAKHLRVVSFDARGSGASSPLRGPTTTRRMAADAWAVVDHARIDRLAVFGQSLGGMVATWMAIEARTRVTALVLASTAGDGLAFASAGPFRGARFARCLARSRVEVESCLATEVLSPGFVNAFPDRMAEIRAALRNEPTPRRTLALHALAGALHAALAEARTIEAPTLCIAGSRDDLVGEEPQRALARTIAGARFEAIPGVGHDVTLESPELVAALVLAFLAERS